MSHHIPTSGELTITLDDGTTLTARTDVQLARAWARHCHADDQWAALSRSDQAGHIASALGALRAAFQHSD